MYADLNTPKYDSPRAFIKCQQERRGKTWEEIRTFKTANCSTTSEWLKNKCEEGWPEELVENPGLWEQLVNARQQAIEKQLVQQEIQFTGSESGTLAESTDPNFSIPTEDDSAWQKYKQHLAKKHFPNTTIDSIETECLKTLKCLKLDNVSNNKDIKGLIIGHVQSGKTANMAGLMAMAADWGFNMFIILTGTIENLRKQTQERLCHDLNQKGCMQTWISLDQLRKNMETGSRAADKRFDGNCNYLTVSLKNKGRLQKLLDWLKEYPTQLEQMNILLIDDESDQAGINTRTDNERTPINRCILDLTKLKARTLNYVAYTATPYANVLNEAGEDTLYPGSFIRSLPLNQSYFGPELIFGASAINSEENSSEVATLDIVRDIPDEDIEAISELHAGESIECPKTLRDAVAWFICATAARRFYKATTPTSMLVHTSQRIAHHEILANEITQLFSNQNVSKLISCCASIWKTETIRLSQDIFKEQYPDYAETPPDYPDWNEIEAEIQSLISDQLQHIQLDGDGTVQYSRGIHLCIDNGTNNGVDDEGNFKRLLYPEQPQECSKAFIVIGGATLSRGLTIEGLVSTFFLRTTKLGDTLMQMGRWFGYRPGYELLPRIWMTDNTQEQFAYLAAIEADLREELKIYEKSGASPKNFGPKISHWAPSLLSITSKNRMKGAQVAESDFSGIRNENTVFYKDCDILKKNVGATVEFLDGLDQSPETPGGRSILFRDVPFKEIKKYLLGMEFHPRSRVFSEIEMFTDWFDQITEDEEDSPYDNWNVIVSSLRGVSEWKDEHKADETLWKVSGKALRKANRSRQDKFSSEDAFCIGSLQDPMDKFLDLPESDWPDKAPVDSEAAQIRENAGLGNTPQLIIYRINGHTKLTKLRKNRSNLDLDSDVIGLLIRVPGKPNKSLVRSISVSIPEGAFPDENPELEDVEFEEAGE